MAPSLFREGFGSPGDLHPRHGSRDGAGKPSHPLGSGQAAGSSGIGRGAARSPYASRCFGWEAEGPVWVLGKGGWLHPEGQRVLFVGALQHLA